MHIVEKQEETIETLNKQRFNQRRLEDTTLKSMPKYDELEKENLTRKWLGNLSNIWYNIIFGEYDLARESVK